MHSLATTRSAVQSARNTCSRTLPAYLMAFLSIPRRSHGFRGRQARCDVEVPPGPARQAPGWGKGEQVGPASVIFHKTIGIPLLSSFPSVR